MCQTSQTSIHLYINLSIYLVDEEQDCRARSGDGLQRHCLRPPEGQHAPGVPRQRVHALQGKAKAVSGSI